MDGADGVDVGADGADLGEGGSLEVVECVEDEALGERDVLVFGRSWPRMILSMPGTFFIISSKLSS